MNKPNIPISGTGIRSLLNRLRSPLYRNSIFLIFNSYFTAGLGFFFWMVVARLYKPSDVGYGSAAISAISLIAVLSMVGVGTSVIRFLPKADKPVALINTALTLCGLIAAVAATVFVLGLGFWSPALIFIKQNVPYAVAFVLFVVVSTSSTILDAVFIARRKAFFVLITDSTYSLLKIPLPFLLVMYFHSFGIAASLGVAVAIATIIAIFVLAPRAQPGFSLKPGLDKLIISRSWRYSTGNYLSTIFSATPTWILPIIIVNVLGSEANAYFYITWVLAGLLGAISSGTSHSLFAEGAHFEEDIRRNIRKTIQFTYLLLIPAIVIMLLLGGWILSLFGHSYSHHGLMLLRVMSVASLFTAINHIYHTTLRIENRIRELIILVIIQSISILTASYLLIQQFDTVGVGYAWLGVHFCVSIYVIIRMIRRYRKTPESKNQLSG